MVVRNNLQGQLKWMNLVHPQLPTHESLTKLLARSSEVNKGTNGAIGHAFLQSNVSNSAEKRRDNMNEVSPAADNESIRSISSALIGHPVVNVNKTTSSSSGSSSSTSKPYNVIIEEDFDQGDIIDLTLENSSKEFANKRASTTNDQPVKRPRIEKPNIDLKHIDYKEYSDILTDYINLQDSKIKLLMEKIKMTDSTSISLDQKHLFFKNEFQPNFKKIEIQLLTVKSKLDRLKSYENNQILMSSTQKEAEISKPLPQLSSLPEFEFNTCDFSSDNESESIANDQISKVVSGKDKEDVVHNVENEELMERAIGEFKVPRTPSKQTMNNNLNEVRQFITERNLNNENNGNHDALNIRNAGGYSDNDEEDNFGEGLMDGLKTPTQERDLYNDLGSFINDSGDESIDATYTDVISNNSHSDDEPETIEDVQDIMLSPDVANNLGINYDANDDLEIIDDDDDFGDIEEIEFGTYTTQLNREREIDKSHYIEILSDDDNDNDNDNIAEEEELNNRSNPLQENSSAINKQTSGEIVDSDHEFSDDDDFNLINFPDPQEKENIPPGTENFIHDVYRVLNSTFKLKSFRPNQLDAVCSTLKGNDVFVLMPTGGGKSLCYQLPALIQTGKTKGTTIVISPLISLMQDQVQHLLNKNIKAGMISSKANDEEHRKTVDLFSRGELDIVYFSPEKVNSSNKIQSLIANLYHLNLLARVVIDEAHCLSSWGHDFRPDYKGMRLFKEKFPKIPVMALTATANEKVRMDIVHHLHMKNPVLLKQSFNRSNLFYEIRWKTPNYLEWIKDYILEKHKGKTGIIYCHSKQSCEQTSEKLNKWGLKTSFYHAGMSPEDRFNIQNFWQTGKLQLICATIAFGMGIDKPDVRFVIHLFIPRSLEGYYQETGRAGRDGEESDCIMFYSYKDARTLQGLIHRDSELSEEGKENHLAKLRQVIQYCENTTDCRRKQVLHYFNESFDPVNCQKKCDNCLNSSNIETVEKDCTDFAKDVIRLVKSIQNEKVTVLHCQDIFKGSNNSKITNARHNYNPYHGKGKNLDKTDVERIFFYLLSENCLMEYQIMKAGFASNYVKVGKYANQVLNGEKRIKISFSVRLRSNLSSSTNTDRVGSIKNFKYQESFVSAKEISNATRNSITLPTDSFASYINSQNGSHMEHVYNELNKIRITKLIELAFPINQIIGEHTLKEMAVKLPTNKKDFSKLTGIIKDQLEYFPDFKKVLMQLSRERKRKGLPTDIDKVSGNDLQVVSPYFNQSQYDESISSTLKSNTTQQSKTLQPFGTSSRSWYNKKGNDKSKRASQKQNSYSNSKKSASRAKPFKGMPL